MKNKIDRKFRKLSISGRIQALFDAGYIDSEQASLWREQSQVISAEQADRMIENVIGAFALPEGIAVNFLVNDKYYAVPMVVEEPSVVAALSYAGLLAEKTGGFKASTQGTVLKGQIQLVDIPSFADAELALEENKQGLIESANELMPNMVRRGGGVCGLRWQQFRGPESAKPMLVVYFSVDTKDAMGANLVNSLCEGIAPRLETLTGGSALLKILSNLADESLATAEIRFTPETLAVKEMSGHEVRDRIVQANDLALVDPYRATTHNKGIMNGVDAVALATGNDWRSIEAAAHAYAARSGTYRALTQWRVGDSGALVGRIEMPMKVGVVGGSLQSNPAVQLNQSLLNLDSAEELAALMASVGLAQNFSALRALASSGIQQGHMTLHARSVAVSASAPPEIFDEVVKRLVESGRYKNLEGAGNCRRVE